MEVAVEVVLALDRHLHAALAESAEQEYIIEGFVEGAE